MPAYVIYPDAAVLLMNCVHNAAPQMKAHTPQLARNRRKAAFAWKLTAGRRRCEELRRQRRRQRGGARYLFAKGRTDPFLEDERIEGPLVPLSRAGKRSVNPRHFGRIEHRVANAHGPDERSIGEDLAVSQH